MNTTSSIHPSHARDAKPFSAVSGFSDPTTLRNRKSLWLPIAIWTVFCAGLLLQLFSPHLQIAHDAFVIPQDVILQGMPIDPRSLVQQEKLIQLSSALLVLAGATALALYYRRTLLKYATGTGEN